jgi:hypothetical protein
MEVGDKMTNKAFKKFKDTFYEESFDGVRRTLGNDLVFEPTEDGKYWVLVSTRESRISGQDNGPAAHRPEQRNFKRYYEGKS